MCRVHLCSPSAPACSLFFSLRRAAPRAQAGAAVRHAALGCRVHRHRGAGRPARPGGLRRDRSQAVHHRDQRLGRRARRLRQRRLARRADAERHALARRHEGGNGVRARLGADQPAVPEHAERHLHGRHRRRRPAAYRLGVERVRRRLRQRRLDGSVPHLLRPQRALQESRRRPLRGRDGARGASARRPRAGARAAASSITIATGGPICSSPTTCDSISPARAEPGKGPNCLWKGIPVNCGPKGLPTDTNLLYHNNGDGTFADVSQRSGIAQGDRPLSDDRRRRRISTRTAGPTSTSPRIPPPPSCTATTATARSRTSRSKAAPPTATTATRRRAWVSRWATTTATAGSTCSRRTSPTTFPSLYRNLGKGLFEDVAAAAGLGVENRYVEWGAGLPDLDNDGLHDIFYVTGNVYPEVERILPQQPHRGPRVVFRNTGGSTFRERHHAERRRLGPALEPRRRVRRRRQRRRRRRPGHEHERAAVTPREHVRGRSRLDPRQARRHASPIVPPSVPPSSSHPVACDRRARS